MTPLESVLPAAADQLARRLAAPGPVSEDLVRYIVFSELLAAGVPLARLALEYPHPSIAGAEIDTVLLTDEGAVDCAFEFKYHRRNPGGRNLPRPQLAGGLLRDAARLAVISCRERALVYLSDGEMLGYLGSAANGLAWLSDDRPNAVHSVTRDLIASRSATLQRAAGPWPSAVDLVTVGHWRVGPSHLLMCWRVAPCG